MRLLFFTAGAAGMYCGSCLRDNALAAELIARGEDVTLVPLYTPTLTDEPNVSGRRVFFNGINVYLQQRLPFFRRLPAFLDRLWESPAVLRLASSRSLSVNPEALGDLTVSMLRGPDGFQRKEFQKLLVWLQSEPRPDLVVLPNSLLIGLARPIRSALDVPVACTLQGEDLFLDGLPPPQRLASIELIRQKVRDVDAFLSVSRYYARFMAEYLQIAGDRMHVVPLGINPDGLSPGEPARSTGTPFIVGYFARVAPEKGLDRLAEAYRLLRRQGTLAHARLEAAGYLAPEHRPYLQRIEQDMRKAGLGDEFHYRGTLDRAGKAHFLQRLDVLSVPGPYDEPKGLPVLEALACGVPVVQPRRGAFPEILETTGGGLLVEPDSIEALAGGIATLVQDPERARELGRLGAIGVREHYTTARMATRALEVFRQVRDRHAMVSAVPDAS